MNLTTRADSVNLDILRSLAVLFVVVSHLPIPWLTELSKYHLGSLGLIGVCIFFVHTCLVLMLSLERQTAHESDHNRALLFWVRRVFRIYPLSIVTVLLMSTVTYQITGEFNIRVIISNLLLIQNLTGDDSNPGALWSLPYEVQMYLLLPSLYLVASRVTKISQLYIVAIWLGAIGLTLMLWGFGFNYHLVKYLPCFIPGVLAFSLRKSKKNVHPFWLFFYTVAIAGLFPIAVAMGAKENVLSWPFCLALGLLIPRCTEFNSFRLEATGKIIAKYSYGIYLIHGPVIEFAFKMAPPIQWIVFVCCTAFFSYIAYHLVERPFIEIGRQLAYRLFRPSKVKSVPETI